MKAKSAFFFLMLLNNAFAQQDSQFTQYMYNTVNINPAYAGSRDAMSVFLLHRTQWVGLDGAPVTNNASIHAPIANNTIGLGLSILNDRIGISDANAVSADVSYIIKTSLKHRLSFGLKVTANFLSVDFNRLTVRPGDVPTIGQHNINNRFAPNIGAGIYYYSENNYVGLSIPHFLETNYYDDNATSVSSKNMHVYFIAGHVFGLNENIKFKPALLTKMVNGAPLQVDVSGNFLINDKFNIGLAYRWNAACSAMAGFQISDSWFIGYGYDLETTKLAHYNSGSHEIFLRYELFRDYEKIMSPRFF